MLNITMVCPAPRGLVIVYAVPPDPKEVDEDSTFTKTEDAACIAYLAVRGRTELTVMAVTTEGSILPASETEGFIGVLWEDDKVELEKFEAAAKTAYFATLGKEAP